MVFPEAESILKKVRVGEYQQTLAAAGFLDLIIFMKKVVIQDACILMDMVSCKLWKHPLFQCENLILVLADTLSAPNSSSLIRYQHQILPR